jgi:NAD(P)-dependent dehydrogenase (short-subunit alcohol dehydrogenase family)
VSDRLAGKVAIVTGATEGIGHAIAGVFVREGARVVLVARREAPGIELAAELGPEVASFVQGDIADPDTADRAVGEALERFGALDVLVNNAALDLSGVPLFETTREQAREIVEVNVFGSFWMGLASARVMAERGGGSIVNLTSRLGLVGLPGSAWYGATKGALHALTRGAAVEWAPLGIRVNSVAPGLTETPMIKTWVEAQDDPATFRRSREESVPLGRFCTPEEVAAAVVYLASDESASVTGASISVDGGYTAA